MDVVQKQSLSHDGAAPAFIQKHAACIQGVLAGFDRLRLRGTLRPLYGPQERQTDWPKPLGRRRNPVHPLHRSVVTDKGRTTLTALLAARQADVDQLTKLARENRVGDKNF
jgi:hypothetical protein